MRQVAQDMPAKTLLILAFAALLVTGCGKAASQQAPAARRYALIGQVLVVNTAQQSLSVKHQDIVGYMPGMTMTFPVARADLMKGREPGELISATLEVTGTAGRLVEIARTGTAPLPDRSNEVAMAAGVLEPGDPVPDAAFIDQHDRRRAFAEWRGGLTLITFTYTRCPLPNFCPLMARNFASIQRQAAADPALKGRVKLVTISFDPEHDTPAVLAAHVATLGADPSVWTFLTGDRVTVDRFAAKFGVGVIREGAAPGEITHNLRTVLIGADGRIVKIYGGSDWSPATALADLRAAAAAPGT